jgi:Crinkler effector protein N-terminal domain
MVKVTLVCSLVGAEGNAFPVDIEASRLVGHLKKAIKVEKPETIKCDADKLQLFLAKKDGAWLRDDDTLDTLLLIGFDTSTYIMMRASWKLNKPSLFAPEVSLGEDVIHVLVVVPEGASGTASEAYATNELIEEMHTRSEQESKKRYVHSEMNSSKCRHLLQDLCIRVDPVPSISFDVGEGTPIYGYQWMTVECGQETNALYEEQNRKYYRKYIEDNIGDVLKEQRLCVFGVEKSKNILTKEVPGTNIVLAGSTDLLVLSDIAVTDPSSVHYLPGVKMLIEVKKEVVENNSEYQAISELMALDLLVLKETVMALLTDLNSKWVFFWFTGEENGCAHIQRVTIKNPSEAFEVIRIALTQTGSDFKLPCIQRPLKRRKLSQLLPSVEECGESGGIRECLEQYYDIASMLGPDIDMARAVANQITRSIPTYPTYMD